MVTTKQVAMTSRQTETERQKRERERVREREPTQSRRSHPGWGGKKEGEGRKMDVKLEREDNKVRQQKAKRTDSSCNTL